MHGVRVAIWGEGAGTSAARPSRANRVDCRLGRPGSVIVFVLPRELREFWAK